jgi:hypothetical protein
MATDADELRLPARTAKLPAFKRDPSSIQFVFQDELVTVVRWWCRLRR